MKKTFTLLVLVFCISAKAQIITTVVGTGVGVGTTTCCYGGDGGQATNAEISYPTGMVFDATGNLYIADNMNNVIRKVNTNGIISTFAGNGTRGYSGDGGQATAAQLFDPSGVAFDASGNLYIADTQNSCIRKVSTAGIITTVAGDTTSGYSGDGGQATVAELASPTGVTVDANGNLYIVDGFNRIRKVNTNGIISTIAGTGTTGYSGDGGPATAAELNFPEEGLVIDLVGNLYFSDRNNNKIRIINTSGIINTFAGNNTGGGYSGDGGQATTAELSGPFGLAIDASQNIYVADVYNSRIRKIAVSGIITTVAGGNGINGYGGDGGQATDAELNQANGVALDAAGNLYIADSFNNRVRKVTNVAIADIEAFANNKEHITIYPNPSTGSVQVTYTSSMDELKVSNMLGQVVYEAKPNSTNTNLQIDNVGVYFITITSGATTTTQKVVVSK